MAQRYVFHLSLPVDDLAAAERFYTEVMGAAIGRRDPVWIDALLWGHQIALQLRPEEVLTRDQQRKRHSGVILPWDEWEALARRLTSLGVPFLSPPTILRTGTVDEQAKLHLEDPAQNVIEIKAYRDAGTTVGRGDPSYSSPADSDESARSTKRP